MPQFEKRLYPQVTGHGEVNNDASSLTVIAAQHPGYYLYLDKLQVSVVEAASGGGGQCVIQDTEGGEYYKFNVDGVKDITIDYGLKGAKVTTKNAEIQAVLSGAATQATVYVVASGHYSKE